MLKFQFNYLNKILFLYSGKEYRQLLTNYFITPYGEIGFSLEPYPSRITFKKVSESKIKAFYKQVQENQTIYYRKEVAITPLNQLPLIIPQSEKEINFEFTEEDRVEKNKQGQWVKK